MNVALVADIDHRELVAWIAALRHAAPQHVWYGPDDGPVAPETVDVAVVAQPPPGALARFPRLRLIQSLWAGVDRLLADPTLPAQVPLARMVDPAMTAAMVETVLWATLSLHRGTFAYARRQARAEWRPHAQRRADEVGVGVLGLGEMGGAAAAALARLGYRVAGWSLAPRPAPAGVHAFDGEAGLARLLPSCDIVVNLLPLTAATRGLVDARFLAALPPQASVVNLARGAQVVDADLLAALDAGRLRHAVLDVFATEPLPPDHPYWRHPRVTVLPHVAAMTDPRTASQVVVAQLDALAQGAPLRHLVDRGRGY